jgi:aminoglycoside phosphotransferase (APT) family kinase protein
VRDGALAAVLDWELCTLGDALADLGYLLNNWLAPSEIPDDVPNTNPTADGGFPSRDELLERYASATGRDVSLIAYYRALSHWRSAAIVEGVYARYLKGAYGKTDVDLTRFSEVSPRSARSALGLLETL